MTRKQESDADDAGSTLGETDRPPPGSGDLYSSATVERRIPDEVLELARRDAKEKVAAKRAASDAVAPRADAPEGASASTDELDEPAGAEDRRPSDPDPLGEAATLMREPQPEELRKHLDALRAPPTSPAATRDSSPPREEASGRPRAITWIVGVALLTLIALVVGDQLGLVSLRLP